ncbi:MAG: hypothetical protein JSW54_12300 [Fidelibacterota bacterium]|nr:MAG: hypothetical protein JSW54_12300 [Candidatus Neomarinimicrobiota bacterium]
METLHEFMLITKGQEYLIAIGFLVLFILFWSFLTTSGPIPVRIGALRLADFRLPKGIYLHPGHTWALPANRGYLLVGFDDFIRKLAGTITEVVTPESGAQIKQGEMLLQLRIGSEVLHLPAPISGRVSAVNMRPRLGHSTSGTPSGPLKREWLVQIKPDDMGSEATSLQPQTAAGDWLRSEMERLQDFLGAQSSRQALAGVALADGGDPIIGALQLLDGEGLRVFEQEFLLHGESK